MKYASYHGLNQHIAMRVMFNYFGKKFIELPQLNDKMLRWGEANAPEYSCFPLKAYMGFFKALIDMDVHDFFVYGATTIRSCRYMDLWEGGKKILADKGYDFNIHYWGGFGTMNIFKQFQGIMGKCSKAKIAVGILVYADALYAVDKLNDEANKLRPREVKAGSVDAWLKKWYEKMKKQKKLGKPVKIMNVGLKDLKNIEIDNDREIIKVAFVGDVFKVHEPFFHFDTIKKINKLGLEARQPITFSLFFFGQNPIFFRSDMVKKFKNYQKKAKKYMSSSPTSYLDISIGEVIEDLENGAKGIIHFQSFGCMPDIMFKPILDRIAKDYNVPIMHFMRDTHASDGAYQTRLEAFSDLVKRKSKK